ncbi:MAG TPA: asparaginase [Kineosporiaceae bacterium]|nr:asparaginase [Kineosporiaceae bacterium]
MNHAVLARVVRSGFVESVHHGTAVAIDADGDVVRSAGAPQAPIFPRSSNKPLQAVAMLRAGLPLDGHLLALGCASHSGERYHLDGVLRVLEAAGLDASALRNTPSFPLDEDERLAWRSARRPPSSLAQNCSGKHAAMLATCVENGWPTEHYLDPDHPLQRAITETVTDLAGEEVAAVGVDGCGAPVHAITPLGLAVAFARLAAAAPGTPEGRVADAVRLHPEWVGGTGRDVTRLVRGVPGIVAKDGAEGVYAAALPDGRAVAVKIADGGERPRAAVLATLLHRLGVEADVLDELLHVPVLGHGVPVGRVEVVGLG